MFNSKRCSSPKCAVSSQGSLMRGDRTKWWGQPGLTFQVSLGRSLKAVVWRCNRHCLYTPVTTLCTHQLSTVQKHTPVEVSPQVSGKFNACVLIWCRTKSNNCDGSMSNLSLSTMMDNLQSCRAAAWGFARHPVGTVWPTGTYRQPLFRTRASQDLSGCACCSLPLCQSASLSPTGNKQSLMQKVLQFYHLSVSLKMITRQPPPHRFHSNWPGCVVCHWKKNLTLAVVPAFLRLPVWTLIR